MINDYLEIRNAEGMPELVDATMSLGFLLNVKSAVRNCAIALTEVATPEVRTLMQKQLDDAINMHEEISNLMINKGWLHPIDLDKQFQMDIESSKNLCLTKSITMSPLVSDNELKTILQQEVTVSKQHIEELRELMQKCNKSFS